MGKSITWRKPPQLSLGEGEGEVYLVLLSVITQFPLFFAFQMILIHLPFIHHDVFTTLVS